jgi:peptide/nickel transport system permease protein
MARHGLARAFGLTVIVAVLLVAALASLLAPHDPYRSGVEMLELPSRSNLLGTDDLGRDILSRVIYGARPSLLIGFGAACVAMLIGVPIGLTGGYLRGRADLLIVGLIDLFIALPGLILALIIIAMVGASLRNLVFVLGFVMWPPVARVVRGQALAVRETLFVEAAIAVGGNPAWIIRRHIWPNVRRVTVAQFAITVSFAIFTSASLSFLGLGIPPPAPDWGGMVRSGFDYLSINPFMGLAPGAAVTLTVMGCYVVGTSFK